MTTAAGRSAVAVVRVWGVGAIAAVETHFCAATDRLLEAGQIRYGTWAGGESIVVTPIAVDVHESVEVHCHGGIAASAKIIADLVAIGCVAADVPFGTDDTHPLIQTAMEVASRCQTVKTVAIAMDQVRGALANWLVDRRSGPTLQDIERWSPLTMRLDRAFDVVLVGPPNVGKSSLINAILGYERSITLDIPGTTRDVLEAETIMDGWPIRFFDTAGMRHTEEAIEREGVSRAVIAAQDADLVIAVRDPDHHFEIDRDWSNVILVLNKSDLGGETVAGEIATVATTGQGIESLQKAIISSLIPEVPPRGSAVALNQSQLERCRVVAT